MRRSICLAALIALAAPVSASHLANTVTADFPVQYIDIGHSLPMGNADLIRGRTELEAGRYGSAVRLLEPLADGSGNPNLVLLTGYANLGAGRPGRAELYFERALRIDYGNALARHGLGLVAMLEGDRDKALAQIEQLERSIDRCAGACSRAENLDRAIQSLRRVVG